jgi:RNA polymerase sigma-70 factor, ECF subfamily
MLQLKLVKKAMKGNKKALEELLILHSDQLYRTAYIYVKNREDALDIVQETSYKAFKSIEQLKNEEYFLTWLTKILINCSYRLLNKKKKELPLENVTKLKTKNSEIEESIDLLEAIDQLDEKYKNTIILFYLHDLPIKEVAKLMNIPTNTVKTYLSRGKNQLKKGLGGMNDNGEKVTSTSL